MTPVAFALGANLGPRANTLARAVAELSAVARIDAVSSFWDTAPMGPPDQPRYLNAATIGATRLPAADLLVEIAKIERQLGRRREGRRWGARWIDIDLLLHGDTIIDGPALSVPHPGLRLRDFVLGPLAEIAPDWRDPRDGRAIGGLWNDLAAAA